MSEVLTEILRVDPAFDKERFLQQCESDIIPNVLEVGAAPWGPHPVGPHCPACQVTLGTATRGRDLRPSEAWRPRAPTPGPR